MRSFSPLPQFALGRLEDLHFKIAVAGGFVLLLVGTTIVLTVFRKHIQLNDTLLAFYRFFCACFLKPHEQSDERGQQSALESFYKTQASAYDTTRKWLLRGREDLLGLVAAQMMYKDHTRTNVKNRPVWVDIGGGTGYNIEAMDAFLPVELFFSHVYLVDFSPSLCAVARDRFKRLGWTNVTVVCQDARTFRLPSKPGVTSTAGADLITMSYSLSMIPDYYSVIDSLTSLLNPLGIIGVCDFYVQSIVDVASRNYIGGVYDRHVNWLGRVFWRAWFDVDRVSLEAARRDYLEYRFGTVLSASHRNYALGGIPHYTFIGCRQEVTSANALSGEKLQEHIEKLDASFTESPYLSPAMHRNEMSQAVEKANARHSKAYESAVINLSSNLPLPSAFYQNHHWRIFYDDLLKKHTQFNDEYIYAFNWEDPRVDLRLLNMKHDDVVLTITSAGDNVLDYLLESPRRVHAVDLNPNQNHLLELKVASFMALDHADVWKLFGEGRHENFRELLISRLSPHMSSQALQHWLNHVNTFTSGRGLYESGGSRHAIMLVRLLFKCFGLTSQVRRLCNASTLNEQREIWPSIRKVLMSRPLHWAVIGTEWFAWKAAGVPPAQRQMIIDDFEEQRKSGQRPVGGPDTGGEAMWEYVVDTLDPVVENTLIGNDNYFYLLCLLGKYSKRCHPRYLSPKAHARLSRPDAFDGLRIHTDEINEVIARMTPGTLTIAVLMDSMDWFDPSADAAAVQIKALNLALKIGGRVLLRTAALTPWYINVFQQWGFSTKRVGARTPGTCIDRVNMYASTWICTKAHDVSSSVSDLQRSTSNASSTVEELKI